MRRDQPEIDDLLLYGWGFLVSLAGASSVLLAVGWPALTIWTVILLAAGFAASWRLRNSRITQNTMAFIIAAALLIVVLSAGGALQDAIRHHQILSALETDELLALVLLGLVILRSFALYTRSDLVFCIVPGLAMLGLLAGARSLPGNAVAFVLFLFASICLASHEHFLEQRDQAGVHPVAGERTQWMAIVSGLMLAVLTIGFAGTLATTGVVLKVPMVVAPQPQPTNEGQRWLGLTSSSILEPPASVPIGTGPVDLSDRVLFTVEAPELYYWRLRTYQKYTGHGWSTDRRYKRWQGVRGVFQLPSPGEASGMKPLRQTITFQVSSTMLVAAPHPVRYDLGPRSWPTVQYLSVDDSGGASLAWRTGRSAYSSYTAVSLVPPPVTVPPGGREPPMPDVGREFLRVPLKAQQVAEPLAQRITAGIPTVAGKALALREYVSQHGEYDLDAPAFPRNQDSVAHFLGARSPRAYCDIYASALAVLCRAAGIPSRFAVGFMPGEFDSEWDTNVVRENDSHAWTEVYIPGQGWSVLDATPASEVTQPEAPVAAATAIKKRLPRLFALAAVLLVGVVAAWLLRLRRLVPRLLDSLRELRQPVGSRGLLIHMYQRALRLLARYGLRRKASQTPLEYLEHVRASAGHALGGWLDSLAQLTHDFMHARYSTRPVGTEHVERARAIVEAGEQELRRNRRTLRKPR